MTNEVPDFEKIANELYEKARFYQEYYALQDIDHELRKAYLAGRKAQVKVDAEIARATVDMTMYSGEKVSYHMFGDGGIEVAKAIESQVIE